MMISAFIKYVLLYEVPCEGVQQPCVSRLSIKRLNAIGVLSIMQFADYP